MLSKTTAHNILGKSAFVTPVRHASRAVTRTTDTTDRFRVRVQKPVFELDPPRGECTFEEITDVMETCKSCNTADSRAACFLVFGLDARKVDAYYGIVKQLEDSIQKEIEDESKASNSKDKGILKGPLGFIQNHLPKFA